MYSFSHTDDANPEGESNDTKWKAAEICTVNGYFGNFSRSEDSLLAIVQQFLLVCSGISVQIDR